ncbi:hypothetical protein V3I05_07800 [Helicobacter mastomyrinus]|uniref:Uncharacterized protein n=1 Tax=Helicobacter mastomyrinus TaxID=287948 RepID=A0ABZ3F5X6_9HELI
MKKSKFELEKQALEAIKSQSTETLLVYRGDILSRIQGYKVLKGLPALKYYLCFVLGKLPKEIDSLSNDELFFLSEELLDWDLFSHKPLS